MNCPANVQGRQTVSTWLLKITNLTNPGMREMQPTRNTQVRAGSDIASGAIRIYVGLFRPSMWYNLFDARTREASLGKRHAMWTEGGPVRSRPDLKFTWEGSERPGVHPCQPWVA